MQTHGWQAGVELDRVWGRIGLGRARLQPCRSKQQRGFSSEGVNASEMRSCDCNHMRTTEPGVQSFARVLIWEQANQKRLKADEH
jgi:hypothetical protein